MKHLILVTSSLLIVTIISCQKNNRNVTETGLTGSNKLVCKVDGEAHIYEGHLSDGFGATIIRRLKGVRSDTIDRYLNISAMDKKYDDNIALFVAPNYSAGNEFKAPEIDHVYYLTNSYAVSDSKYYLNSGNNVSYKADTTRSFIIFTRYDKDVVSGKFEFYGLSNDGKKVVLSDGLFNITN